MLKTVLLILQLVTAVALVVFVLLQQKGSGVGSVFGGETAVYRSKRGVEKILHYSTIISAVLLGLLSLYSVLLG